MLPDSNRPRRVLVRTEENDHIRLDLSCLEVVEHGEETF